MVQKKYFVLSIFLIFLTSSAFAVTVVTDNPATADNAQSFAQINARITDLANQISALRSQDGNLFANVMMKSDLQTMYDNMVRIGTQTEQSIVLDEIIVVVVAFAILFLLIGKNMIPAHKKEEIVTKEKENKRLLQANEKLRNLLEKQNSAKEKKGSFFLNLFKKKPKPITLSDPLSASIQVSPVKVSEAIKKDLGEPVPKWREEIIRAKARLELLEEMEKNNKGV